MATPTCPKPNCSSTSFEHATVTPKGSRYKFSFICCASCGAVVGVLDSENIGQAVAALDRTVKDIERTLQTLR